MSFISKGEFFKEYRDQVDKNATNELLEKEYQEYVINCKAVALQNQPQVNQPQVNQPQVNQPIVSYGPEFERRILDHVFRFTNCGEGDDGSLDDVFSGIELGTSKGRTYFLVNLHSFSEDNGKPLDGFPGGWEKEFQILHDTNEGKSNAGRRRKKVKKDEEDDSTPIKLRIEMLADIANQSFATIAIDILVKENILLVSGMMDAVVFFFDTKRDDNKGIPPSRDIHRSQHVHIFGFADVMDHSWYGIRGEIMSTYQLSTVLVTAKTEGMSGGAAICDGTGHLLAYLGGAKNEPFGVYCFRLDAILVILSNMGEIYPLRKVSPKAALA